jgi:hypothetical protein
VERLRPPELRRRSCPSFVTTSGVTAAVLAQRHELSLSSVKRVRRASRARLRARVYRLACVIILRDPWVVSGAVDLACDLIVAGLDTPATVEVAALPPTTKPTLVAARRWRIRCAR